MPSTTAVDTIAATSSSDVEACLVAGSLYKGTRSNWLGCWLPWMVNIGGETVFARLAFGAAGVDFALRLVGRFVEPEGTAGATWRLPLVIMIFEK